MAGENDAHQYVGRPGTRRGLRRRCRTPIFSSHEQRRVRSGSERLAFLVAGATGLAATFAGLVLVSVFLAFLFAVLARVGGHTRKLMHSRSLCSFITLSHGQ